MQGHKCRDWHLVGKFKQILRRPAVQNPSEISQMLSKAPVVTSPPCVFLALEAIKMTSEPRLLHPGDTGMYVPVSRTQAEPREGAGAGCRERRPFLLDATPTVQSGGEVFNFLVPYQRQDPGCHCFQHMHRSSCHKEDCLRGHVLHVQKHCQA